MKTLPLTKIGFFNPGRLSDEEIEQSFISRIPFFQYLFERIIEEKENSIPQHYLIIGQRGMGKTSLLVRIAAEMRKEPYRNSFIALSFPEEQYNIDRLSKFWLNCLDALADALDKENDQTFLGELDKSISKLSKESSLDPIHVYQYFNEISKKIGRRPVLLVDNLNLIFNKINKEEAHQLRGILIGVDAPILVGTSTNVIEETNDYGAPFYDAFQISYLKKLSFAENIEILENLARITGNPEFSNTIKSNTARLETIYQLTGGTPRTIAILFPLIQDGFSESIQTDIDALLDAITPLYKARFEELSDQLQVIMDAIALHWDPINLEQLRDATKLENATLTPQLKRLVDVGWINKMKIKSVKGNNYELSERFFNIWYLMRRSSRRQKRDLYSLTKFLESFYGSDVENLAKHRLSYNCNTKDHFTLNLALAEAVKNKNVKENLLNKTYDHLLNEIQNDKTLLQTFDIPEAKINEKLEIIKKEINELIISEKYLEIESKCLSMINLKDHLPNIWATLGILYDEFLNRYEDAEHAYKRAIGLDETDASSWNNLGDLYQDKLSKFTESEEAYKKAIALDENSAATWYGLGKLLTLRLSKYTEAEEAFKKAIALDENNAIPWNGLGNLYQEKLSKYSEAEEAYKKAIALDENFAIPWNGLGNLHLNHFTKYSESEEAFKTAIALDENSAIPWNGLGNLYQEKLSKYSEAEEAYKKAIALDENFVIPWNGLGNLYQYKLGKFTEAEEAYKKAIALDKNYILSWIGLGNLYQNHLAKYSDAEEAFKKAKALNENDPYLWDSLGNFYQDHLGQYSEAEAAYKKAITLDPENYYSKYNLVFLWRDKMGKIAEAKELFLTIDIQSDLIDCHYLNEAIFAFYEHNLGIGEGYLHKAMEHINGILKPNTTDDWYRMAGVLLKLGFGLNLLKVLEENEYDVLMRPFYVAISALHKKDEESYLFTIAAEVREPAKKIMEFVQEFMK